MIYIYSTESGKTEERDFPLGQAPASIMIDGETATRDYAAEAGTQVVVNKNTSLKRRPAKCTTWPMRSDQLGLLPREIPAEKARLKKLGITGVDFDNKTGEAIMSKRGFRDYARLYGKHHKQGGYSDP